MKLEAVDGSTRNMLTLMPLHSAPTPSLWTMSRRMDTMVGDTVAEGTVATLAVAEVITGAALVSTVLLLCRPVRGTAVCPAGTAEALGAARWRGTARPSCSLARTTSCG